MGELFDAVKPVYNGRVLGVGGGIFFGADRNWNIGDANRSGNDGVRSTFVDLSDDSRI